MTTQISMPQLKSIFEQYGADVSERQLRDTLEQCNEQADVVYNDNPLPSRSATEWAHYYAGGEAEDQRCEGVAAADFQRDAYGID
ncbi:Uncharacterised protein [Serratia marcescens]|uniref:hypothetical protein n=1 Tax=Serratia marcescens TaxID=615 RepID=UPI0021785D62|nr:hypothetical protein [Serratia marcescens]CAI1534941.1 Uncharacterised protein [Serratia marcescens]